MNELILLSGTKKSSSVIPPSGMEPYRIGWNILAQFNDQPAHTLPPTISGYGSAISPLYVLTHYSSEDSPPLNVISASPFDGSLFTMRTLLSEYPYSINPPMVIRDIASVAHADRTGLLPKIFFLRHAVLGQFTDCYLMRYNLNASGSRYIAIKANMSTTNTLEGQIEMCLDGTTVITSPMGDLGVYSSNISTEIRLIITHNNVSIRISEPGTFVTSVALPERVIVESGATFSILGFDPAVIQPEENMLIGVSDFIIYEGTF